MTPEFIKSLESLQSVLSFWTVIWGIVAVWAATMFVLTCIDMRKKLKGKE